MSPHVGRYRYNKYHFIIINILLDRSRISSLILRSGINLIPHIFRLLYAALRHRRISFFKTSTRLHTINYIFVVSENFRVLFQPDLELIEFFAHLMRNSVFLSPIYYIKSARDGYEKSYALCRYNIQYT